MNDDLNTMNRRQDLSQGDKLDLILLQLNLLSSRFAALEAKLNESIKRGPEQDTPEPPKVKQPPEARLSKKAKGAK